MKTVLLGILIIFSFGPAFSQIQPTSAIAGIRVYDREPSNALTFTRNQAALAKSQSAQIGISGERMFMLSELSNYMLAVAFPLSNAGVGLCLSRFGSTGYTHSRVGLAYSQQVDNKIDVGVQFNYNNVNIQGYGSASVPGFEIGAIFHFSEKFHFGMHAENHVGGKFGLNHEEKLPAILETGFGYRPSETFFITTILTKEENVPMNLKIGLDYKMHTRMMFSAGINSETGAYWLAATVLISKITVTICSTIHPNLGSTPGLMLNYEMKKTTK